MAPRRSSRACGSTCGKPRCAAATTGRSSLRATARTASSSSGWCMAMADCRCRPPAHCRMKRSACCERGSIREPNSEPKSGPKLRRRPCRSEGCCRHRGGSFPRSRGTRNIDRRRSGARHIDRRGRLDAAASCGRIRHAREPHVPRSTKAPTSTRKIGAAPRRSSGRFTTKPRCGCSYRAARRSKSSRSKVARRCIRPLSWGTATRCSGCCWRTGAIRTWRR